MEALEQLTHRVTVRGGIILVASLVVVLIAGRGLALHVTQQTGSKRTDLQRHDLA